MVHNNKAQQILLSTTFMVFVFLLAFVMFSDYLFGLPQQQSFESDLLTRESIRLANSLVQEGYPTNWSIREGTVQKIGLFSGSVLNTTKVEEFHDNAKADRQSYESMKKFLSIQHDYMILFEPLANLPPSVQLLNITSPVIQSEEELLEIARIISVQERLVGVQGSDGRVIPVNMKVMVYQ